MRDVSIPIVIAALAGATAVLAVAGVLVLRATRAAAGKARALVEDLAREQQRTAALEREMKERTATLEQRNGELGLAMEKLRRAQDDSIRNEKLASMGRLVAGIAHEVNNPMNAVLN